MAWNQADDCTADRLLGLRAQIGALTDLVPDRGAVTKTKIGNEIIDLDVGVNVFVDGVTDGSNTLTSASSPFTRAMIGLPITITGHGRRVIEAVIGPGEIEFSGQPIAAATGVRFTQPLGITAFDDGRVDGNTLTSASQPFSPELVGRRLSLHLHGSREVTAYVSASEVTFDGSPLALQDGLRFTLPVVMEQAERSLSTNGGQIVDSRRVPSLTQATVVRWRFGERRRRGKPRQIYVP